MKTDQWPAQAVEMRPVKELVPYARNARTHTKVQVAQIAASIQEWGWTNPLLVDEDGNIIAGHGRVLAAQLLGLESVPCMVARGWSEAQKRAYVIADNRLALNAGWDEDLLRAEFTALAELDFSLELTGFGADEIQRLTFDGTALNEDGGAPPLPEVPTTRFGELWTLGKHRVLCGDSTSPAFVEQLLAGAKPRLMVTDPPYGVAYNPEWRKEAGVNKSDRMGKVQNDDRADWTEAWKLFPGDVAYVWHAGRFAGLVAANLEAADLEVRSQIIWAKSRFALSRGNYHWQHEPCWYAVRRGTKAYWSGDRRQSTLWEIPVTDDGDHTVHGTQKPLECMGRPQRNHDAIDVYDPFLGTGSTLIAAEALGRTCYGIDLDPRYVDVAVQRWQNRTGLEATMDGRSFEQIQLERTAGPLLDANQEEG